MSRAHDHHQPCPCGAELADECPRCNRINPLGSMRIEPAWPGWTGTRVGPDHDTHTRHPNRERTAP